MKPYITLFMALILLSSFVYASPDKTIINRDKAYVRSSIGNISQEPHTIGNGRKAILKFDTELPDTKYDACFFFPVSSNNIKFKNVERKNTKAKKNVDRFGTHIECIEFDKNEELEIDLSYNGYGKIKYDVYVLPKRYGKNFGRAAGDGNLLILDPWVAGSPIHNYTFNGNEGTYNSTYVEDTGNNDLNGTVSAAIFGKGYIGTGYYFDGANDHINTTLSVWPANFSVSVWLNITGGTNTYPLIHMDSIGTLYTYRVQYTSGKINFVMGNKGGGLGSCLGSAVTQNVWYHYVTTYNNATRNASLYRDGVFECSFTLTDFLNTLNDHLYLGEPAVYGLDVDYLGHIDELLIYNFTLNHTEVTDLYDDYNYSSLAIIFRDEQSDAIIETMELDVTNGSVTTNFDTTGGSSLIRSVTNQLHKFKHGTATSGYRTRYFTPKNTTHQHLTFYSPTTSVVTVTVNVKEASDSLTPVSNASVKYYATISGTSTLIDEQLTTGDGLSLFDCHAFDSYSFTISKAGYGSISSTFQCQSGYALSVDLGSSSADFNLSYSSGIKIKSSPDSQVLDANQTYNFSINLTSTTWNITDCNLSLFNHTNETNDFLTSRIGTYNITGCNVTLEYFTGNITTLFFNLSYEINSTHRISYVLYYSAYRFIDTNFTLMDFKNDIVNFTEAGFDDFGKSLIAFIIIFAVAYWASLEDSGIGGNRLAIGGIIVGMVILMSYLEFFKMTILATAWLNTYWLATLSLLTYLGYFLSDIVR